MTKPEIAFAEADVRPALRAYLLAQHAREPDTILIEELGICRGQVRLDLALVNGRLHGYEIKSDRDNLRRLGAQAEVYGKVLDRVTLVAGTRHLPEALDLVPSWWGAIRVDAMGATPRFKTVRRSRRNPGREPRSLVELLWLEDAISFLDQRGDAQGVRGKPRRIVWDRICERFGVEEIAAAVRDHLKARSGRQAPPPLS